MGSASPIADSTGGVAVGLPRLWWRHRVRPLQALFAVRRLIADPDATGEVISFIVFVGRRSFRKQVPGLDIDALVAEGAALARAAEWLPALPLEDFLEEPLVAVRRRLGLVSPVGYERASYVPRNPHDREL